MLKTHYEQVSEAEEQEQSQVDSIKQQEGLLTQAKTAAALARWRRLQVIIHPICLAKHSLPDSPAQMLSIGKPVRCIC